MIVVTGATGQLGHLVIASLLKKVPASNIVAAVRNVEKAKDLAALGVQVRHADYNQPASWDAALKGADKVLLISSSEIGQRARQHQSVIDAAKRAGVKLLAYTSILHADTSPLGLAAEHRETEAMIRASGVPYVLLRHSWYTENYTMGIPGALAHGAVYGCAGDGRISSATRADYAEADVAALTAENQAGRIYELAGDTSLHADGTGGRDLAPVRQEHRLRESAGSGIQERADQRGIAGTGCRIALRFRYGRFQRWTVRRRSSTEQAHRQADDTDGYVGCIDDQVKRGRLTACP